MIQQVAIDHISFRKCKEIEGAKKKGMDLTSTPKGREQGTMVEVGTLDMAG